jgi:hypothetical protein
MDGSQMSSDAFCSEAVLRVRLAEATLQSLAFVTDHEFLTDVYERYRGRSFEVDLSFSCMLHLVSDALLRHRGSLLPALEAAKEDKQFEGAAQGVYGKLRRCPQSLSHGFLAETAVRLMSVMNPPPSPVPNSLQAFEVLVIDGKKIKNVAKRLKPTRSYRGSVLGGKVLAAMDLATGMVRFMSSDQDGQTNDVPLVPPLLNQMRSFPSEKPRLLVLDSQFCDLGLPRLFDGEGCFFVIRWSLKTSFERDESRDVKQGVNKEGFQYSEEWGWMGSKKDERRRYVRRMTVFRPGEEDVLIFTNLLDEIAYPAADVLDLYRQRWSIENVFQQVTEVFHLEHLISCSPCGTIFQFAFCCTMYNMLILQRSYIVNAPTPEPGRIETVPEPVTTKQIPAPAEKPVAAKKKTKAQSTHRPQETTPPVITIELFSMEKYFKDVREELIAWMTMIPLDWTLNYFSKPLTVEEMKHRLRQLLHGQWKSNWLKAAKQKHCAKKLDDPIPGGHTSVYRLLHGDPRTKVV